jgi:hypothetical protein
MYPQCRQQELLNFSSFCLSNLVFLLPINFVFLIKSTLFYPHFVSKVIKTIMKHRFHTTIKLKTVIRIYSQESVKNDKDKDWRGWSKYVMWYTQEAMVDHFRKLQFEYSNPDLIPILTFFWLGFWFWIVLWKVLTLRLHTNINHLLGLVSWHCVIL